jgi:ribulose-bisphosphate carboxylase large chain
MPSYSQNEPVHDEMTTSGNDVVVRYLIKPKEGTALTDIVDSFILELKGNAWTDLPVTLLRKIARHENRLVELTINEYANYAYMGIAYPGENLDLELGGLGSLLSIIAGDNISSRKLAAIRIADVRLPRSILERLPGPSHGVRGVRQLYGVPRAPILQMILKPRLGLEPDDYASLAYRAAKAGIDAVRDDQMLISQAYAPFEQRVASVWAAIERARDETGRPVQYYPNVTLSPARLPKVIDWLRGLGIKTLTVNGVHGGLGTIELLRSIAPDFVIQAHRSGYVLLCNNQHFSISYAVLARLLNIAGADEIHVGSVFGRFDVHKQETLNSLGFLAKPGGDLRPSLPVVAGNVTPGTMGATMRETGRDAVLMVGSGILGHPDGVEDGVRALKEMLGFVMEGSSLQSLVANRRVGVPLLKALNLWGYKPDGQTRDAAMQQRVQAALLQKEIIDTDRRERLTIALTGFRSSLRDDEIALVVEAMDVSGRALAAAVGQVTEKYVRRLCLHHDIEYKQLFSATGKLFEAGLLDVPTVDALNRIRRHYNMAKHKAVFIFFLETYPLVEGLVMFLQQVEDTLGGVGAEQRSGS